MSKAFRCIDNDAVNKAMNEQSIRIQKFDTEAKKIADEFGGEPHCSYWRNGRRSMNGVKIKKGADAPGKNLRLDNGYSHLYDEEDVYVPNARTKAGKELRERIHANRVDSFSIPGLPMLVFLPEKSLMLSPGSYLIDDNWYADYSFDLPEREAQEVDHTIWEDMRASDLLRLREDEQARKEQEAKDSEVRDAQGNVARIKG